MPIVEAISDQFDYLTFQIVRHNLIGRAFRETCDLERENTFLPGLGFPRHFLAGFLDGENLPLQSPGARAQATHLRLAVAAHCLQTFAPSTASLPYPSAPNDFAVSALRGAPPTNVLVEI